ncbi:DUF2651 domain-containing protein [Pontibacillus yanchengensis]|uniref:DUF2651 domain-containing protein n=1 Tax=Pontibacillus yanchengensis TaxID=462910 RepID=A0A6I5A5L8_9BACI|nr:DUF2651 domain-containing protein [Pontibacillus yanchengensis]
MNLFELVVFVFPLLTIGLGIFGYFILKKTYKVPLLVFIVSVVATYTIFNPSFWGWVVVYTLLSFGSGLVVKFIISKKNK